MCFEYDGIPEFHNSRMVKSTRKPHQCEACNQVIPTGSMVRYSSGKYDGEFYTEYVCDACLRIIFSIAAEEIKHGCMWHESFCSPMELQDYLHDRSDPVVMLTGSLDECAEQVNELWKNRKRVVSKASGTECDQ